LHFSKLLQAIKIKRCFCTQAMMKRGNLYIMRERERERERERYKIYRTVFFIYLFIKEKEISLKLLLEIYLNEVSRTKKNLLNIMTRE